MAGLAAGRQNAIFRNEPGQIEHFVACQELRQSLRHQRLPFGFVIDISRGDLHDLSIPIADVDAHIITVDNDTFMFFGEASYSELQEASGKKLVSLGVPAETAGKTGVAIVRKQNLFPKNAKIGILSGNEPAIKAAGDSAEAELKKAGYNVAEKVEINIVGQETPQQLSDAAAAVATLKSAGVDTVFITVPFTVNSAFFDEANKSGAGFKYMLIDWAQRQQKMQPTHAWGYVIEAQYGMPSRQTERALGMALYLDPASPRLAGIDPQRRAAAQASLKANNPFLKAGKPQSQSIPGSL